MRAMAEPMQQRGGQLLIAKNLHPFAKGEITCDQCGALAMALRQDVEEQLPPARSKGTKPSSSTIKRVTLTNRCWTRPKVRSSRASTRERTRFAARVNITR